MLQQLDASGIRFFGGIFPAVIRGTEVLDSGAIVQKVALAADPAVARIDGDDVEWTTPLPEIRDVAMAPTCLVLSDFACLGIDTVLDQLFNRHADDVNYCGAGAGNGERVPSPVLFTNQGRHTGAALVANRQIIGKWQNPIGRTKEGIRHSGKINCWVNK